MKKLISVLFPNSSKDNNLEQDRRLVARYSRGNVNLQRGKYATKAETKRRKEAVLSHKFG